jgi:hypothetical protein
MPFSDRYLGYRRHHGVVVSVILAPPIEHVLIGAIIGVLL